MVQELLCDMWRDIKRRDETVGVTRSLRMCGAALCVTQPALISARKFHGKSLAILGPTFRVRQVDRGQLCEGPPLLRLKTGRAQP